MLKVPLVLKTLLYHSSHMQSKPLKKKKKKKSVLLKILKSIRAATKYQIFTFLKILLRNIYFPLQNWYYN